jgi:hypothetical protein
MRPNNSPQKETNGRRGDFAFQYGDQPHLAGFRNILRHFFCLRKLASIATGEVATIAPWNGMKSVVARCVWFGVRQSI